MSSSPILPAEALFLELEEILGAPVLLSDEEPGGYYRLRELIRKTIAPTDTIEALWVRDITDLTWESLRYRRWKSAYHRFAEAEGAAAIYYQANGHDHETQRVVAALAAGSRHARGQFARTMKAAGYDKDVLAAAAFCASRHQFEFLERMIAQVESRRDALIREVERRREAAARRLRDIVDTADAEIIETDLRTSQGPEGSLNKSSMQAAATQPKNSTPTAGTSGDDHADGRDAADDSDAATPPWHQGF